MRSAPAPGSTEVAPAPRVGPGRAVTAPPPPPPGVRRHLPYTLPGLWFALLFTCLSFTPSLLPRSGLVQGLVCGLNAAIGYGLGVFAAAAWRAVADRDARPPRPTSCALLAVAAAVALPVAVVLGRYWQDQSPEKALRQIEQRGVTYPSVADPSGETQQYADFAKIVGMPTTFFVDADGKIAYVHVGQIHSESELTDLVRDHLGVSL